MYVNSKLFYFQPETVVYNQLLTITKIAVFDNKLVSFFIRKDQFGLIKMGKNYENA